jgi:hypothetical protein
MSKDNIHGNTITVFTPTGVRFFTLTGKDRRTVTERDLDTGTKTRTKLKLQWWNFDKSWTVYGPDVHRGPFKSRKQALRWAGDFVCRSELQGRAAKRGSDLSLPGQLSLFQVGGADRLR